MRKDKEKAIELRKTGKSYEELKKELGIPKSTLSDWFRNQKWSNEIAQKLIEKMKPEHTLRLIKLDKIRGENLEKVYAQASREAEEDYDKLKFHPLFISGIVIYWGEGDKRSKNRCCVANTDPRMIKIYVDFLRKICQIDRLRLNVWLLLYPDLDENTCKQYWIDNCSLKQEDFVKSIVIEGRHKSNRLSYGVCNVVVSSTYLKKKIDVWIDLLSRELSGNSVIG